MASFKIINDVSEIKLGQQWIAPSKFNSIGRLVHHKGRQYRIIEKRDYHFSHLKRLGRGILGTVAIICTLCVGLFAKSIRNLFTKSKESIRFAILERPNQPIAPQARDNPPTINKPKYQEYEIDGKLKIRDATKRRIQAKFVKIDPIMDRRVYKILIDGHEAFTPTGHFPLQFAGAESLTFKEKAGYFQIKERDNGKASRYYVDSQKIKNLRKEEPLLFFHHKPCQLTEKQIEQRLEVFKANHLQDAKDIQIVAHNKHGLVVVGWDNKYETPFYGSKQMPFVAYSHANDEKWNFYTGRDFGRYGIMNEPNGNVKIMHFTSRGNEDLEIHRYFDQDTNEEKIVINSEIATKLSPAWMK